MRLPTWDEIVSDEDQHDVLEFPLDQPLFVVGPPGSGKTVLALQRAKMMGAAGITVKLITYNRMLRRLLELLGGENIDVKTMHRFVSCDYRNRMGEKPPELSPYNFDWETILEEVKNNREPHRFHLIVDEGQDLPQAFFTYASYVSDSITVFADEDQALNKDRSTLENIKAAANLDNPAMLKKNHRNSPEIATVAEHFHRGRLPAASIVRSSTGELPRLSRTKNLESTAALVSNWYSTRGGSIGVIFNLNTTGNELHTKLREKLPKKRVDMYSSKSKPPNEDSIDMLSPGVTLLNKKSVKGQEFDTVFILELESFIPSKTPTEDRAMYMMCTRARDNLFLVYGPKSLSVRAEKTLPGPDALERL